MYLTQALHRAVQQHPNRIAVRFGERQSTFLQLTDRVARLAGALQCEQHRAVDQADQRQAAAAAAVALQALLRGSGAGLGLG